MIPSITVHPHYQFERKEGLIEVAFRGEQGLNYVPAGGPGVLVNASIITALREAENAAKESAHGRGLAKDRKGFFGRGRTLFSCAALRRFAALFAGRA
jgi:hypothetical protein